MTSRELLAGPMVATIFVRRMTPLSTYDRRTPATKEPFDPLAAAHGFRGIFDQKLFIGVQPSRLRVGNDVEEEGLAGSNSAQTASQSRSEGRRLSVRVQPSRPGRRRLLGFVSSPFLAGFGFIGSISFLSDGTIWVRANSFPDYEADVSSSSRTIARVSCGLSRRDRHGCAGDACSRGDVRVRCCSESKRPAEVNARGNRTGPGVPRRSISSDGA